MEALKKFGRFIFYLSLFIAGVYFISSDAFSNLIPSGNSDKSFLIQVASYFKDIDTWAIIFMVITFGLGMGSFLLISLGIDITFKKIGNKFPKLNFLNAPWADFVFQIPTAFVILLILFVTTSNLYVSITGANLKVDSISKVKNESPVFILGTAKMLSSGKGINLYYKYRIDAALDLWKAGKVKFFILSGDGVGEEHTEAYDETKDMREDLLAAGIPDDKIKIDKYGFNTLNSILRLRGVFKLNNVVIISQDFHTPRALVLSKYYGIESQGFDARGSATSSMLKKEIFQSRPKLIMDILFANMQPRVVQDGEFAYREEFSATKSNRHVLIVLIMLALVFIAPMGLGIYRAKEGVERKKAARKYSIITVSLSIVLVVLVFQVYKNLDIKFIDEIVETTAKAVGVQTKKMEEKKFAIINNPAPIRTEDDRIAIVPVTNETTDDSKLKDQPKQEIAFNTATSDAPVTSKKEESTSNTTTSKVDDDPFNSAEGEETGDNNDSDEPKGNKQQFTAIIHNNQDLENDGSITLRLTAPLTIKGKTFPKNHLFEAKSVLFGDRFMLVVNSLGGSEFKNFADGELGNPLESRHDTGRGYSIADGEKIIFKQQ